MPSKTSRRKSTAGKTATGRRSRWSPQQIEEWRRRDREIMGNSTDYLENADRVRQFAKNAASGGVSARILGYSLRNQILLEKQAAELGFDLTDVASAKEWRTRGRRVKAEWYGQGLRLVAPKGKQQKDADPDAEPEHDTDADDTENENDGDDQDAEKTPKTRFRTVAVFDLAQTEAIPADETKECPLCNAEAGEACRPGCTCGACVEYEPVDDAADVMWNSLLEQIGKAEYSYDWPAPDTTLHGARVHVDHDARTVHAALNATADDPDAVADLAAALADIIARADRASAARRAERQAARALTAA
jgi:hypothetical protein